MKTENIRNIALVGHGNAGKTSLAEACLHIAGVTKRMGSVTDGTTVLDYTDEEKEKQHSLETSVCAVEHDGHHINMIDTPGLPDFCGQSIPALAGADTAVVVVAADSGIEVNTRRMFQRARDFGLSVVIVVNKIDHANVNLEELVGQLKETFGDNCLPVNLPTPGCKSIERVIGGSGDTEFSDLETAKTEAVEAICVVDDELMEKYLGGEASEDKVIECAVEAVSIGELIPIVFTTATGEVGVKEFMDAMVHWTPSPIDAKKRVLVDEDDNESEVDPANDKLVGQVFHVSNDVKSNIKYSFVRILSGRMASDHQIHTLAEKKGMRPGTIYRVMGAEHKDLAEGVAGDIVALAKVDLHIGDVVFDDNGGKIALPPIPTPMYAVAVEAKARGDEDKIAAAFKKFSEEDPCFQVERNPTTHETVVHGVGDAHVRMFFGRLAKYYKVEVETHPPKIPYRETILGKAENIEYTHKKQSGGAGQFGRVIINVIANERGGGYEFVDKIFGGAIDQSFRPSVDKGIQQQMTEGVLAGYPVVDVKVELIDGKTHPVDSKDIAFQIAGRGAFKDGFLKAKPVLLEPVVNLEVTAPVDNLGDLQGDIASRRGQPVGQEMLPGQMAVLKARVPLAEVSDYHSRLSSITGGQGSYMMEFSHYDQVPSNVQQKIVEDSKKPEEHD